MHACILGEGECVLTFCPACSCSNHFDALRELDGQLVSLPLGLNSQLMVFCSGQRAVVETAAGITLTFDWHSTVHVKLPSPYQGAVCGLCGNSNAMPQDDLAMRDSPRCHLAG
ncbi:zonadhesin [Oncorhynchus mykiss]|uniref:zonadhesin n=1 Tax=Oncorhynchus mykiss TaxID=8022 RepID=UPI001877FE17|nr:zonadhesin [Oncorhynchus mykiss]